MRAKMEGSEQVTVRLPRDLIQGLDRYLANWKRGNPGLGLTRSDAMRVLLSSALGDFEEQQGRKKKGREANDVSR